MTDLSYIIKAALQSTLYGFVVFALMYAMLAAIGTSNSGAVQQEHHNAADR